LVLLVLPGLATQSHPLVLRGRLLPLDRQDLRVLRDLVAHLVVLRGRLRLLVLPVPPGLLLLLLLLHPRVRLRLLVRLRLPVLPVLLGLVVHLLVLVVLWDLPVLQVPSVPRVL
jgi:hypothetical protein